MKAKSILLGTVGLTMGVFLTYIGARELINSIRLDRRGKSTTAEVLSGRDRVSGRLRWHTYYLTILFKDAAGESIRKEVKVSKDVYTAGQRNGSTKAFYLAETPTVCAAGDTVEMRYGNLLIGLLVIGGAAFLGLSSRSPANLNELAERIEAKLQPMITPRHEYAPANLGDYQHLDHAFYAEAQQCLEQHGYTFIADQENITLRKMNGNRTLLRLLLGGDRATQAFLYHFKHVAAGSTKESKVLDLQTSFSNGTFVCTSNAQFAGKFESPPSISSLFIPGQSWQAVVETHQRRVTEYLAQHPGVKPVLIHDADEFQRVMDALQALKAEFRRQQGISQADLERISGKTGPQIRELAEILKRRWETRNAAQASPAQPA